MLVEELQALAPEAKVYALGKDAKHIIVIDPNYVAWEQIHAIVENLHELDVPFVVFVGDPKALKVLEVVL